MSHGVLRPPFDVGSTSQRSKDVPRWGGGRWTASHSHLHGMRHLRFVDNFALSCALGKCRACSYA